MADTNSSQSKKRSPKSPRSASSSSSSSSGKSRKKTLVWLARATVVLIAGLAIGTGFGVFAVNRLEPGRPDSVDSLAVMLDSLSAGRISGAASKSGGNSQADGDFNENQSASNAATSDSARAIVPSVVGFEEGAARDAILEAGLQVGEVQFSLSGRPAGTVLATSPNGGTPVAPGFAVSLVLSDGRGTMDTVVSNP